jgi:hypothetical protein
MKYKKSGWELEYIPRSFREQIEEIIDGKVKRGYWECPNCGFKKGQIGNTNGRNEKKETVS